MIWLSCTFKKEEVCVQNRYVIDEHKLPEN